jgi:hypothetical protein
MSISERCFHHELLDQAPVAKVRNGRIPEIPEKYSGDHPVKGMHELLSRSMADIRHR